MFDDVVDFVRSIYGKEGVIPLHNPLFIGNEKQYINECIDSTYVSSVGKFVDKFEEKIAEYTGSNYAVATTNGTSALHIAFLLSDVIKDDEDNLKNILNINFEHYQTYLRCLNALKRSWDFKKHNFVMVCFSRAVIYRYNLRFRK